jgi:sugar O-acyltransferase (sialic acid O-acetyltransferase NeuD family)
MTNAQPSRSLIIIGAGGHAVSVASVAIAAGYAVQCFVDPGRDGTALLGFPVVAAIDAVGDAPADVAIAVGDNAVRERLHGELIARYPQLHFPLLVHPSATISFAATLGEGTVVMPGAIVGAAATVGRFCVVNTRASLDHDGVMQDFASLAPAAVTGGAVQIGRRSAVSIGATIKHGLRIGQDSVVGAHSYLHRDLPDNQVAYGVPAKIIRGRACGDAYLT